MRFYQRLRFVLSLFLFAVLSLYAAQAANERLLLASTTSAENSGLFDYLLPIFAAHSGIQVQVIAVGTGQALAIAERGDADVVIVHDRESELAFVAGGCGIERRTFMFNDYVIVGPLNDPAGLAQLPSLSVAMKALANHHGAVFLSRGDDSGTHKRESSLWQTAGIDTKQKLPLRYLEIGGGMGRALNMANSLSAYTLSDRSTWLSFQNRSQLKIIVENKPPLLNPYSIIRVNPKCHPHVHQQAAQQFSDWLTSESTLAKIELFKINGQQLFFRMP